MRLLWLVALGAVAAAAQDGVVKLEKWRMKVGDNPRWAAPDFDDSGWAESLWPVSHRTGDTFVSSFIWYRTQVELPAKMAEEKLAFWIQPFNEVFDVYLNGVRVFTAGEWEPKPRGYLGLIEPFAIPAQQSRMIVAIRRWTGRSRYNFNALSTGRALSTRRVVAPEIGLASLIGARAKLLDAEARDGFTLYRISGMAMLAVGALTLALFLAQRARRDYFWLAVASLNAGVPLVFTPLLLGLPVRSAASTILISCQVFEAALWSVFLAEICARIRLLLRLVAFVQGMTALYMVVCFVAEWQLLDEVTRIRPPLAVLAALGAAAVIAQTRQAHSAILAAALILPPATQVYYTQLSVWFKLPSNWVWHGVVVDSRPLASLVMAMTTLTVLYTRHRREQRRQSALNQELSAARMVQEALLGGSSRAESSAFAVEAAYLPAAEVGGDFYLELRCEGGSALVLVGDVSGKGLKAALLVGHVSGALSNERSRRPAEVLANLNECLVGRTGGGFVTCCCARFEADGWVTVANAGHPSPYADGREVDVESGLPLGVVAKVEYSEVRVRLGEGSQVTLVSDGVVEAADSKGELFGFERTREVSGKSATAIAEAAREWGQTDDITVVTVRRAG